MNSSTTAVWRTVQMLFLHTTGTSELNLHPYKAMYSASPSASPAGYENTQCVCLYVCVHASSVCLASK